MGPIRTKYSSNRYGPWNPATRHDTESTNSSSISGLPQSEADAMALIQVGSPRRLDFPADSPFTTQPRGLVVRQASIQSDDEELNDSFRVGTCAVDFIHKMMFELPHVHEVIDILKKLEYKSDHASTSNERTEDPDIKKIMHLSVLLRDFDREMDRDFPWLPKALHALRQLSIQMEGCTQDKFFESNTPKQDEGIDMLGATTPSGEVHGSGAEAGDNRVGGEDTLMLSGSLASPKMTGSAGDPDSQLTYSGVVVETLMLDHEPDTYSQYSVLYNLETPPITANTPTIPASGHVPGSSSQRTASSSSRDGLLPLNAITTPTPSVSSPQSKAPANDDPATSNRYSITCVVPGIPEPRVKLELDITIKPYDG
ncbi:hypothetical protein FRC11_007779 [Ceratobasidium sp. 423]|nr:hypothetical protein FRC11_007779 [Ceratobasidium sp. 423]